MSLEPEREILALRPKDQVRMANHVLAGWQIVLRLWEEPGSTHRWRARRTRPDRQLYAYSLRSLLDYIDGEVPYKAQKHG